MEDFICSVEIYCNLFYMKEDRKWLFEENFINCSMKIS